MTKVEIMRIALALADEMEKRADKMLNEDDLMIRLRCKSRRDLCTRKKSGVPLRKKKGIVGFYAFESDLNKYFKNQN